MTGREENESPQDQHGVATLPLKRNCVITTVSRSEQSIALQQTHIIFVVGHFGWVDRAEEPPRVVLNDSKRGRRRKGMSLCRGGAKPSGQRKRKNNQRGQSRRIVRMKGRRAQTVPSTVGGQSRVWLGPFVLIKRFEMLKPQ